jgi:hypothetical protein
LGSRANVVGPVNRGDASESCGTYRGTRVLRESTT